MPASRAYSAGKFAIEIDGSFAGFIESVEGGEPVGVLADEPPTSSGLIKKHLSSVRFEPIRLTVSNGMSSLFYGWISEMLARTQAPRNGAIAFHDFQLNEINRLEWMNGLITEVVFPKLDGSSKEAATFTVTITPELTTFKPSSGKTKAKLSSKKSKKMLASNFKFSMGGLENASTRVRSIDSITIKESERDPQDRLAQPPLHVSNVVVTLPMVDAVPWLDFLEDFVIRGNNADEFERKGSIELLDLTLKDVQFTLDLQNVGIVRAGRVRADSGSAVVATLAVELYCESVVLAASGDAVASDAPAVTTTAAPTSTSSVFDPAQPVTETLLSLLLERGGEDVQRSLANVLRGDSVGNANPEVRAKLVAARLQSTNAAPAASASPKREDGVALGERWASEHAALGELEQVARLEVGDWTAVRLASDHTLIGQLQKANLIPADADGAFELERSDFVEGVIAGAAKVLRAAAPHLKPVE